MDLIITFLLEVVLFSVGKWLVLLATMGRVRPRLDDRSQPLVTLLGAGAVIALVVVAFAWYN